MGLLHNVQYITQVANQGKCPRGWGGRQTCARAAISRPDPLDPIGPQVGTGRVGPGRATLFGSAQIKSGQAELRWSGRVRSTQVR